MHSIHPRRPGARALRFAPVSGEHSTALRIAMGYFTLTGATTLLFGTIGLGMAVAKGLLTAEPAVAVVWAAVVACTGFGALWTGRLLQRRRRLGGFVAIATLLTPVVQWATGSGSASGVLFSIAGAAVVASVWNELE